MAVYTIPVAPTAKGRPRVVRAKNGHSMTYTPDKTVDAEERIRWHLRQANATQHPKGVALVLTIQFVVARPKSKPKSAYPTTRPDLDQYLKLFLDAGNGILWEDDSQVVSIYAGKQYGDCAGIVARVEVMEE